MIKSDKILNKETESSKVSDNKAAEEINNTQLSEEKLNDVNGGTLYDLAFNVLKTKKK